MDELSLSLSSPPPKKKISFRFGPNEIKMQGYRSKARSNDSDYMLELKHLRQPENKTYKITWPSHYPGHKIFDVSGTQVTCKS